MSVRLRDSRSNVCTRAITWVLTVALAAGVPFAGVSLAAGHEAALAGAALTIGSDPVGAAVYVDGKLAGQTPLVVGRLVAGDHRVTVSKDGYLDNQRLVSLGAGQRGAVQVNLTRSDRGIRKQTDEGGTVVQEPVRERAGGGGAKKALLIVGGLAVVGGGVYLALPKNKAPVVTGVSSDPASGTVGIAAVTEYRFTAQASDPDGDTLTYEWNFGDGGSGSGANPTHVYAQAGTFNVSLTVKDPKGKTATGSASVTVVNLTGTWNGSLAGTLTLQMTLTQSGSNLTGSVRVSLGGISISDTISTGRISTPRQVRITLRRYSDVFIGTVSADGRTIEGTDVGEAFSVTRQ